MILDFGNIRVSEDERFSVYDIIRVIGGKKSPRETWKRLTEEYPEVVTKAAMHKFPGAGQRKTPVVFQETAEEIMKLLNFHPEQIVITRDKFYPRTESQIVSVLQKAFYDCEPCTQFYCNGYRIDLYLAKHRIAIEIDERGHKDYCSKKEAKRELDIRSVLACSFVRFDPYAVDFNLGKVIADIRDLLRFV